MAGSALYYETAGAGDALILIHAGVANLRMWDEQVKAFKSHMVNLERPAEFNRAVAGFLDAHPIASGR